MSFYKENILNKNSNDNTSANILKISKISLLFMACSTYFGGKK